MGNLKFITALVSSVFLIISINSKAQSFNDLDKSPHDIVYHRVAGKSSMPIVKVIYGRPKTKSANVFGNEVPLGKLWRTGSNEATEVKFYQDIMFGNKFVKAGTYVLYTIPNKNYWTIILNKQTDSYGTSFYDSSKDVAKIKIPASEGEMLENFTIAFSNRDYGSLMILAWAETRIKVPLYIESGLLTKR